MLRVGVESPNRSGQGLAARRFARGRSRGDLRRQETPVLILATNTELVGSGRECAQVEVGRQRRDEVWNDRKADRGGSGFQIGVDDLHLWTGQAPNRQAAGSSRAGGLLAAAKGAGLAGSDRSVERHTDGGPVRRLWWRHRPPERKTY